MYCVYCTKFQYATLREEERNGKGKITYQTRYCPSKDDMKREKDISCDAFDFVSIFWCNKYAQKMFIVSCLNRIKNKFEGCGKCEQGKTVSKIHYKKEKPILIKRRN